MINHTNQEHNAFSVIFPRIEKKETQSLARLNSTRKVHLIEIQL